MGCNGNGIGSEDAHQPSTKKLIRAKQKEGDADVCLGGRNRTSCANTPKVASLLYLLNKDRVSDIEPSKHVP